MSGEGKRVLNAEHLRILRAAAIGGLYINEVRRYVIVGGARPARREREQLQEWGLLDWHRAAVGNMQPMITKDGLAAIGVSRVG